MQAPIAITARLERNLSKSSPPGSRRSRPATLPAVKNEPYIGPRRFLVGQIGGNVGAEASQCGSKKKVDTVEAVKARTGNRHIRSTK